MNKKRFISLLVAMLMIISSLASPVHAIGSGIGSEKPKENELKGQIIGDKEVFEFDASFIPKTNNKTGIRTYSLDRATQSGNTTVILNPIGIKEGETPFDWSTLPLSLIHI